MCFTTSRLTLYPTVQKHILLTVFTSVELYFAFFSFCFEKTTRNFKLMWCTLQPNYLQNHFGFFKSVKSDAVWTVVETAR